MQVLRPENQYKHFPLDYHHFRLLKLRPDESTPDMVSCSCIHSSLDDHIPPYVAISYFWGDPTTTHYIKINGKHVGITENVYNLLRSRHIFFDGRLLWIDAICIDQTNDHERAEQVKLMGEIYSQSSIVKIWIGEASQDSREGFDLARELDVIGPAFQFSSIEEFGKHGGRNWNALRKVYEHPWFERAWVIQEALLPPLSLVICGENTIECDILGRVVLNIVSSGLLSIFIDLEREDIRKTVTLPRGLTQAAMIQKLKPALDNGQKENVLDLLLAFEGCKATDPRDRVFSLLGIAADSHHPVFEPNYRKSVEALYRDITRHYIQRDRDLQICRMAGIGWKRNLINIPSWTPDFSSYFGRQHIYNYTALASMEHEFSSTESENELPIRGFLVDTVDQMGPPHIIFSRDLDGDMDAGIEGFFQWYLRTKSMFLVSDSLTDSFWRTLVANRTIAQRITGPIAEDNFLESFLSFETIFQRFEDGLDIEESVNTPVGQQAMEFKHAFLRATGDRRFCKTHGGRFGLVPLHAKIGDPVCILYGANVLFLLRPVPSNEVAEPKYLLVGDCYIHSLMEGEGLNLGLTEQNFILV